MDPAHLNLSVTIEPSLDQHGDKRGEEGSSQTRVKDGLDADNNGLGATPRSEGGIGIGWNVSKRDAGDNPEEVVTNLLIIRLEVLLNVDNENGCNCGEKTGLYPQENQMNTASNACAKRILTDIKVVSKSSSYFFVKSRLYLSVSRWNLS